MVSVTGVPKKVSYLINKGTIVFCLIFIDEVYPNLDFEIEIVEIR